MNKAKKANKPSDARTVIKLEMEVDQLQLKSMRDFYNDKVGAMDKYEVEETDGELRMLMRGKNHKEGQGNGCKN